MEEIDIWRTAQALIEAHGDSAWLEVARRTDCAIDQDDEVMAVVWKRVLRAVEELERKEPIGPLN